MGREDMWAFGASTTSMSLPKESIVINAAGIVKERTDVSGYETVMVNGGLPHLIAKHPHVSRIIHVSTDCVFDGKQQRAYSETDQPTPVDLYGRSKLAGELPAHAKALTVRTSFIGFGKRGLISWLLSQPANGSIGGYQNWPWNGIYARTLARNLLTLAIDSDMTGLLHIEGVILTKYDVLARLGSILRPDIRVNPTETQISKRMVLSSYRISGLSTPSWDEQFDELRQDAKALGIEVYS